MWISVNPCDPKRLQSCNLQLYGMQLLWNITDDHAGEKKKRYFIGISPRMKLGGK